MQPCTPPDGNISRRDFKSVFGQRSAEPNEEVRSSWLRSLDEHKLDPDRVSDPDVLTYTELVERRASVEELSALCLPEIDRLLHRVMEHAEVVMLSDAQGVVIQYRSSAPSIDTYSGLRVLPGSIWTEDRQGTTGVGLCLREQRALSVVQDEHFSSKLASLSCTVAPIFGSQGRLIGVLNVTSMQNSGRAVQSMIRELVASSARRIENFYFERLHANYRVLRLSKYDDFLDVAAEARVAIDGCGRIIDATPFARKLLIRADGSGFADDIMGKKFSSVAGVADLERSLEGDRSTIKNSEGCLHFKLHESAEWRSLGTYSNHDSASPSRNKSCNLPKVQPGPSLNDILGTDPQTQERLKFAVRLHARSLPLLLQGESGVGKTQLARSLHQSGPHSGGNFVAINCAAIPNDLIESEFFGYRPGAFTGAAKQGSPGRLIAANGGTLFLDEIGDMPLPLQARLLQVLSEGEFVPVGGVETVKVSFALITASLRDLPSLVRDGKFREDLFFRINGASLLLPPLRERKDRARLIEEAFWVAASQAGQHVCELTTDVMDVLMSHCWPGNMRELQHVAKFSVAVSESSIVDLACLPYTLGNRNVITELKGEKPKDCLSVHATLAALTSENWNVSMTAKSLGISRATLHRRIVEFDLKRPKHHA
ncbi:sigma-54-dependent Fis family transcriptional regulator [Rhodoferax ferrireducens]|uniref:sigma-54-dependent Fis family transcriptional regulator n=1 Tax=Rhodoferax ferrireducens TaxID=192843 RepID=UPI000E0D2317|nr:sigma-54-dependent Fis family transcriptional regulator [Rhodoferax ferrireducens]